MKRTAQNDEFLKKRKARQRRIRRRRILIGLTLLIVLLIAAGAVLSLTVFFPIETLTAAGSEKYTAEQITELSGIDKGDNLFTASVKLDAIREKLPYIESVKLKRSLPDTLTITVTDAEDYACYYTDNKYFKVSKAGYVLDSLDEMPQELPIITATGVKCVLGKKVAFSNEKTEKLIGKIGTLAAEQGLTLNSIDVSDELSITVKAENRFAVNLGTSNYLESKFAHLAGMIKNIDPAKTGKINLSMWTADNTEGTFVEGSIE